MDDDEDASDDDEFYRLMRGAPSFIVTMSHDDRKNYRPKWLRNESGTEEMIGYNKPPASTPFDAYFEPNDRAVEFVASLMINKKGED
jgi:hypothetical protein